MVGRLVEQQQVGAAHQRPREVQPHAPAAGKARYRLRKLGIAKAQPVQQFRSAGARAVAADLAELLVQFGHPHAVICGYGGSQVALDFAQPGVAVEREVERIDRECRRLLCDVGDNPVARHIEIAGLLVQFVRAAMRTDSTCRCRWRRSGRSSARHEPAARQIRSGFLRLGRASDCVAGSRSTTVRESPLL